MLVHLGFRRAIIFVWTFCWFAVFFKAKYCHKRVFGEWCDSLIFFPWLSSIWLWFQLSIYIVFLLEVFGNYWTTRLKHRFPMASACLSSSSFFCFFFGGSFGFGSAPWGKSLNIDGFENWSTYIFNPLPFLLICIGWMGCFMAKKGSLFLKNLHRLYNHLLVDLFHHSLDSSLVRKPARKESLWSAVGSILSNYENGF